MERVLLVHGYSAESDSSSPAAIKSIYAWLPDLLRGQFGDIVDELDLSRYISLEDGITIDDVSRAMNRALETDFPHLLQNGFNAITHSTGALVVRNWLRRYWDATEACPARRVIHLAGANFGSGWAAIGKSQLAKWGRLVFQGSERGVNVLNALELGSSWTIDMHGELEAKFEAAQGNRPMEFCIIGSQRPDEFSLVPVKYATENGADGVVRVPGCNLNYSYLKFVPKAGVENLDPDVVSREAQAGFGVEEGDVRNPQAINEHYHLSGESRHMPAVPFAIVNECSHTYKSSSILGGTRTREQVLRLVRKALESSAIDSGVIDFFNHETAQTRDIVRPKSTATYALFVKIRRQPQYDGFAQVVFRVFDQYGAEVPHFNIYFNSFGGDAGTQGLINELFEDGHPNSVSNNTITFYLRIDKWEGPQSGWQNQLDKIKGCTLQIDAQEHGNPEVSYVPLSYSLDEATLKEWVMPNQTTIIDVHLFRMPSKDVFRIVASP